MSWYYRDIKISRMHRRIHLAEVVASLGKCVAIVLLTVLEVSSLAGCASSQPIFETHAEDAAPVERLAVFAYLDNPWSFEGSIYLGLQRHMKDGLAACGVRSMIFGGHSLQADDSDTTLAVQELQPSARLTIVAQGGDRRVVKNRYGVDAQIEKLRFELELFDYRANKVTWSGSAEFKFSQSTGPGKDFATGIISQLRADGVLKGCRR